MTTSPGIPSKEAKKRFSEILRRVRTKHEEVTITIHGKPVVKIIPITGSDSCAENARTWLVELSEVRLSSLKL